MSQPNSAATIPPTAELMKFTASLSSHRQPRLRWVSRETAVFPLYEVEKGHYRLTVEPPKLRPVRDYLRLQGRFRHLRDPEIAFIQSQVRARYELLLQKCQAPYPEFPPFTMEAESPKGE